MTRRLLVALGILLGGHLLMWPAISQAPIDGIDERMRLAVGDVFGAALKERRYAENPLLPRNYVLFVAQGPSDPIRSVYLARFPRDGVAQVHAHDPELCYATAGYSILDRGQWLAPVRPDVLARVDVLDFRNKAEDEVFVLVWKQPRGEVVDRDRAWWRDSVDRLVTGRSDFVWGRAEIPAVAWRDERAAAQVKTRLMDLMRSLEARFAER